MLKTTAFFLIALVQSSISYVEVVSASVTGDGGLAKDGAKKAAFTPQVAFKCGFRNRYFTEEGVWKTDPDARASCLNGKLDVLKYCRRVYRHKTVTNIVESSQFVEIDNWCKIEGTPCKWSFWVKPYRCIVGRFESDTLLVPNSCHFDHVDRHNECKSFDHWNQTAISRCQRRSAGFVVHSFAMLEPCDVDMFSGVEFVCCPKGTSQNAQRHPDGIRVNVKSETSEFEKHDAFHLDEQLKKSTTRRPLIAASIEEGNQKHAVVDSKHNLFDRKIDELTDDSEDDDDDDDDDSDDDDDESDDLTDDFAAVDSKSSYLRVADPKNEHEAYQNALMDLNKQHREKVSKVMKEWAELEDRFIKMKTKDPVHAENFKAQVNSRFQKTVSALEEENAEERSQIEQVHQQRIVANLNEKKRHALMEFQQLYSQRKDNPEPRAVLHVLKAYVRAEEKERLHLINHYRHLLRTRTADALASEVDLLGKLLEIDRRIGSTFDLLHSHPQVDGKVKSAILDFFNTYRRENTPDMPGRLPDGFLNADQYRDLMDVYRAQVTPKPVDNLVTPGAQKKVVETVQAKVDQPAGGAYVPSELPVEREEAVADRIYPAEERSSLFAADELDSYGSFNTKQRHSQDFSFHEQSLGQSVISSGGNGYVLLSVATVCVVAAVICGVFIIRQRSSRSGQGFIEVNACTPEECHVANMQITGYENPAYKYFEERA